MESIHSLNNWITPHKHPYSKAVTTFFLHKLSSTPNCTCTRLLCPACLANNIIGTTSLFTLFYTKWINLLSTRFYLLFSLSSPPYPFSFFIYFPFSFSFPYFPIFLSLPQSTLPLCFLLNSYTFYHIPLLDHQEQPPILHHCPFMFCCGLCCAPCCLGMPGYAWDCGPSSQPHHSWIKPT